MVRESRLAKFLFYLYKEGFRDINWGYFWSLIYTTGSENEYVSPIVSCLTPHLSHASFLVVMNDLTKSLVGKSSTSFRLLCLFFSFVGVIYSFIVCWVGNLGLMKIYTSRKNITRKPWHLFYFPYLASGIQWKHQCLVKVHKFPHISNFFPCFINGFS